MKLKYPEYSEIFVHSVPVTYMCLSYDQKYLFSGGEDGSLFILKIKAHLKEGKNLEK